MVPSNYYYVREKLASATFSLAVGAGDVRSRLRDAFLCFHTLQEEDFPDPLKKDWCLLMKTLTKFGPVFDHKGQVRIGSVENTLQKIRNSTGVKLARIICDLEGQINGYFPHNN